MLIGDKGYLKGEHHKFFCFFCFKANKYTFGGVCFVTFCIFWKYFSLFLQKLILRI